jgi:hypothetical protein
VPLAGNGLARPYLDRPLFPLGVALPQMLEKVAVELTTAEPAEKLGFKERADVLREGLTLKSTRPPNLRI